MSIYGDGLGGHLIKYELVGSRVTCDPPPTDTDQDILVLVDEIPNLELELDGWKFGGSRIPKVGVNGEYAFSSFKKGDLNYIITTNDEFYNDFLKASKLAKQFNLLVKQDRIDLFAAIMRTY